MLYDSMNLLTLEQLYWGTKMENLGQPQFLLAVYYKIITQHSKASSLLIIHW